MVPYFTPPISTDWFLHWARWAAAEYDFSRAISVHELRKGDVVVGMYHSVRWVAKLVFGVALLVTMVVGSAMASDWRLIGPDGGNVRCLAYDPSDPNRILLGTSAGQLFVSKEIGRASCRERG